MGVEENKPDKKSGRETPDLNTNRDDEDLEHEVSEPHRKAKQEHIIDHNHTVRQADDEGTALHSGRRKLSHRNPSDSNHAKKKRDKEQALFRAALKQLQDHLNKIFEEITAINERLNELFTEIDELERLKELAENNLLDPKNPEHAKLLHKYGFTQDDLDSGRLLILLNEQLGYRMEERTALEQRRDDLQAQANEAIYEAQADGTITPEEAEGFRERLESLDAGVSAQVRNTSEASQELKNIAIEHYTNVAKDERVFDELALPAEMPSSGSVAGSLDGDASYQKGIQSQSEKLALQEEFTAKAKQIENNPELEEVAPNSIAPNLKGG